MSHPGSTTDPQQVVRAVAAGVSRLVAGGLDAGERERQLEALLDLYAQPTDVRHPFAPLGAAVLRGREQLREHFEAGIAALGDVDRFDPVEVTAHLTEDPEVVVFEFAYAIVRNGRSFEVPNIFVTRVREGKIVESRDYAHHVGMARGFGRLDALADALASDARPEA